MEKRKLGRWMIGGVVADMLNVSAVCGLTGPLADMHVELALQRLPVLAYTVTVIEPEVIC